MVIVVVPVTLSQKSVRVSVCRAETVPNGNVTPVSEIPWPAGLLPAIMAAKGQLTVPNWSTSMIEPVQRVPETVF